MSLQVRYKATEQDLIDIYKELNDNFSLVLVDEWSSSGNAEAYSMIEWLEKTRNIIGLFVLESKLGLLRFDYIAGPKYYSADRFGSPVIEFAKEGIRPLKIFRGRFYVPTGNWRNADSMAQEELDEFMRLAKRVLSRIRRRWPLKGDYYTGPNASRLLDEQSGSGG